MGEVVPHPTGEQPDTPSWEDADRLANEVLNRGVPSQRQFTELSQHVAYKYLCGLLADRWPVEHVSQAATVLKTVANINRDMDFAEIEDEVAKMTAEQRRAALAEVKSAVKRNRGEQ